MSNEEEVLVFYEEPAVPLGQKLARFKWTISATNHLLDLYEAEIDNFMAKHTNQRQLWDKVLHQLRTKLPKRDQDKLSGAKLLAKFHILKHQFKKQYFSLEKDETIMETFPFYEKMHKMFTDYAMRKLNETNPLDETTEEDLQLMVSNYLSEALDDNSDHQYTANGTQSKSEMISNKINNLPKESIFVTKGKLPIEPNTPFSRNVSQKLIPQQRNSILNLQQSQMISKRKLEDDPVFLPPKIKTISKDKVIKKINSTDVYDDSHDYIVEAIDDCELSNITMRHSKVIYHDQSSKGVGTGSTIQNVSNGSQLKDISNNKIVNRSLNKNSKILNGSFGKNEKNENSSIKIIMNETIKSADVLASPSNYSIEEVSDTSIDLIIPSKDNTENYSVEKLDTTYEDDSYSNFNKPAIVPKNLMKNVQNFSTSTNESLLQKLQSNPEISIKEVTTTPSWFKSFLVKYESDVKNINDKLDKILAQSVKPLENPKIAQLKKRTL